MSLLNCESNEMRKGKRKSETGLQSLGTGGGRELQRFFCAAWSYVDWPIGEFIPKD